MFKNYIKIALRNIKRHKGYSFINIFGLAIGLAVFILIFQYIQYELSYDKYHENSARIIRIVQKQPSESQNSNFVAMTPGPLAPTLTTYPEVISAIRLGYYNQKLITFGENSFLEDNFFFTDPEIFNVFSLELLTGNPKTALSDPNSILISERIASKYFGADDPMDKIITYQNSKSYKISGVFKNIPSNSHFKMEFITSFSNYIDNFKMNTQKWYPGWYCYTYCLMEENTNYREFEDKLLFLSDQVYELRNKKGTKYEFATQELNKIHLHSNLNEEISENNNIMNIYIFTGIAILILLIACTNYVSLTCAHSTKRNKEVGIRKVAGAKRLQLIKQFIGESVAFTILAFIFALLIVEAIQPTFNVFFENVASFSIINNIQFIILIFILILLIGIITGIYPALYISSFTPSTIFQTSSNQGHKSGVFRQAFVIMQFSISIILIISTFIVKDQMTYIKNNDVGYTKDQIIVCNINDKQARKSLETVKTELLKHPDILQVATSDKLPNAITGFDNAKWSGMQVKSDCSIYIGMVDYDFVDLYDIEIVEGRNFSREFPNDENGAILINETTAKKFGWDKLPDEMSVWGMKGKIVGVVKDFHFQSLYSDIEPMLLYLTKPIGSILSIKVKGENIPQTIEFLKNQINKISPNYPFEYEFFDDVFNNEYKSEQRMETMFGIFTLLAMFISCLGLFGLATFSAEQRRKEICIRKILGSSVSSIVVSLSVEFANRILIASIFAWPIAWFAINTWLQNFAYRIQISLWIFISSTIIVFIIALLTISYQSINSAMQNPVKALKYE